MLEDDRDGLRGGNVVARCPLILGWRGVEVFLDELFSPR
jgi:hypothetical protein